MYSFAYLDEPHDGSHCPPRFHFMAAFSSLARRQQQAIKLERWQESLNCYTRPSSMYVAL